MDRQGGAVTTAGSAPRRIAPWLPPATLFALSLIGWWSSGYKNAVVWIAFFYVVFRCVREKRRPWTAGLGWPILAWLGACLLASIFSNDSRHSYRNLVKLLELAAGFVAVADLLRGPRRTFRAAAAVAAAFGLLWAVDAGLLLADVWSGRHLNPNDGRWLGSLFGYPTIAAGTYAPILALCVVLFGFTRDRWARAALALAVGLCGLLLAFLQARSVLVGLAAGLGLIVLAALPGWRSRALVAAGAILIGAGALAASASLRDKLLHGSTSDRSLLWKDAVHLGRKHPWLGWGYGHGIFEKVHRQRKPWRRGWSSWTKRSFVVCRV